MEQSYRIVRSKRKTAAITVTKELEVVLRLPLRYSADKAKALVLRHQDWIAGAIARQREHNRIAAQNILDPHQIEALKAEAKACLPRRVAYYGEVMGLSPTGVKITSAQKRWGSCSSKNSLCFSYTLMRLPPRAIDYVVVHELAHIRHKNHSREFYRLIEDYLPDYRELVKQIKDLQKTGFVCPPQANY